MQKDNLTVATITANYNNGKHIKECLDSLAAQTRRPNLITIVDDKSTDNSVKIISPLINAEKVEGVNGLYNGSYDGINVIFLVMMKNSGAGGARNAALNILVPKMDIICIADADDVYYPEKIEQSVEVMKKFPVVGLVYSDYDVEDLSDGRLTREYKEPYSFKRLFEECIVSNNSVISSNVFKLVGGYDDTLRRGEDYDLWLRIAEKAAIHHIPESLYRYRLTGKNVTVTTPAESFAADIRRVHQKAIERRNRNMQDVQ